MAAAPEAREAGSLRSKSAASRERAAGCLVASAVAMFALGLGVLSWLSYPFRLEDDRGIVSWVTLNEYPIQQEPIAFVGSFVCVGLGVWLGHWGWIRLADLVASRSRRSSAQSLRVVAVGASGLGVSGLVIASGVWSVFSLLVLPIFAACATAALAWRLRDSISASPHSAPLSSPGAGDVGSATGSQLPRWVRVASMVAGGVFIYALVYDAAHIFLLPIDSLHEGERLAHLTLIRHGAVPYRDFFVQHGLGQDVGKAWLAATLQDGTLAGLRLTECAIRPLGAVALYLLGLTLYRSWITAVLLVLILTTGALGVPDRLALGLVAVAALAHWLRLGAPRRADRSSVSARPSTGWVIVSGGLTAAAFLYSTEVGLYAGAACGGTLVLLGLQDAGSPWARRISPLGFYALGFGVGMAPLLVYLTIHGALGDFARNTWLQIDLQRTVWGLPYPPIQEELGRARSLDGLVGLIFSRAFPFYLPILILLGWTGSLVYRACRGASSRDTRWQVTLLVLLFGVASFASALGRSDDRHLMYAVPPAYALLLVAFEGWARRAFHTKNLQVWIRMGAPATLCAALFGAWWLSIHPPVTKHVTHLARAISGRTLPVEGRRVLWRPLGAMGAKPEQLKYLKGLSDYVSENTKPGESFYDFTNQGILHYLADRPSASRFVYVAYAATTSLQLEVLEELEERRPELVIDRAGHNSNRLDGIPAARRHPLIDSYLRTHYTPSARLAGALVLRRR